MDPVSYSKASQQEQRIKKIIAEPDSVAGLVSVPNLVPTGETITIPAGRTVVHPNLQVDGTLVVDGTLFIPSGGTYTADELDVTVVKQNGNVVANLESPAFIGVPTAPTAVLSTNTTQIATTAFVKAKISGDVGIANSDVVKTALNATGLAPIYACRAWVNFNGTGTVAIRASGNVSSITDNGTARYTVNLTLSMPDTNYSAVGTGDFGGGNSFIVCAGDAGEPTTVSTIPIFIRNHQGSDIDASGIFLAIFR